MKIGILQLPALVTIRLMESDQCYHHTDIDLVHYFSALYEQKTNSARGTQKALCGVENLWSLFHKNVLAYYRTMPRRNQVLIADEKQACVKRLAIVAGTIQSFLWNYNLKKIILEELEPNIRTRLNSNSGARKARGKNFAGIVFNKNEAALSERDCRALIQCSANQVQQAEHGLRIWASEIEKNCSKTWKYWTTQIMMHWRSRKGQGYYRQASEGNYNAITEQEERLVIFPKPLAISAKNQPLWDCDGQC